MSRPLLRAGIAAASAALAGLVAWALLPHPREETVELVDARGDVEALLESAWEAPGPADADGGLLLRPVSAETALRFFPAIAKNQEYDEHMLARRRPGVDQWARLREHPKRGFHVRTNSLGLREDGEVAAQQPDVRVLVVGDSHVEGVCDNADAFPNLLEAELAARHPGRTVEVLNAACGGWSFYNYLGALEGYADLRPDLFVLVAYGGNDFHGSLALHHFHRRERLPPAVNDSMRAMLALSERGGGAGPPAQYLFQAAYFHDRPGEEEAAREAAELVTAEVARLCQERGIGLLCVYLPPFAHAQPELCAPQLSLALWEAPLPEEALLADERLADAWLAFLAEGGIAALDLRAPFRGEAEPLYWRSDHHLNLAGHRAAARALLAPVEELCGLAR